MRSTRLVVLCAMAAVMWPLVSGVSAAADEPAPITPPTAAPTPTPTTPATPQKAQFKLKKRPTIAGTRRYGKTLEVKPATWSGSALTKVTYQWLRSGKVIKGATGRTHKVSPYDVGHRLTVRVRATRSGYATATILTPRTAEVKHRRDVRRTVTYRVIKDGSSASSKKTFAKQAAETYADARGWRGAGIRFKEVKKGGSFTLVLAKASRVTHYSRACSTKWSCRVGRYVIINETRWRTATPTWRKAKRSTRDYRHMVINHETGHWFGKGHAGCSRKGRLAPIMMQQSKGLKGCKPNPWPTTAELKSVR